MSKCENSRWLLIKTNCCHILIFFFFSMLDMLEKKSREVSVEPPSVSRPAVPYDGEDGGSLSENEEDDEDDDDII